VQAKPVLDRNTAPFVPSYKKGDVSAPKGGKNLEDLRAVLRTLSSNETAKTVSKIDVPQSTVPSQNEKTPPISPLRASLAAIVDQTAKTAHSTVAVAPAVKPRETVKTEDQIVKTEDSKPHAFTPRAVLQQSETTSDTDPLSPKKLERMMRTTGNDTTPLS
jgi:hypothetical protein